MSGGRFRPCWLPKKITGFKFAHVACDHIRLNDWVLPYHCICKAHLNCVEQFFQKWADDPNLENSGELLEGIYHAFEQRLADRMR